MALEAQNNPFTSILMVEAADVEALPDADPAAGQRRLAVGTDHLLYLVSDSGVKTQVGGGGIANPLATDSLWDAAGDLVQGTGANTSAKLSAGTAGKVLTSNGAAAALTWETPSGSSDLAGKELDYVQITSPVNITNTSDATADTIITGSSVAYDGSTVVLIECFLPYQEVPVSQSVVFILTDGGTVLGRLTLTTNPESGFVLRTPVYVARRLTPSNASHTYAIKAYTGGGTAVAGAGAGGTAAWLPAFMRITRVSS